MKNRNPIAVLLLPFVTFGIYGLYWFVSTKGEMKKLGADIPTAWLIIVPIINLWWYWKYCEGVEKVTNGKMNGVLSFILFLLVGCIGSAIVQSAFNDIGEAAAVTSPAAAAPTAPVSAVPEPATAPAPISQDPTNTPPANPVS